MKRGKLALLDKYASQKASPDEFDALLVAQDAARRYALDRKQKSRFTPRQDHGVPPGTYVPIPQGSFQPLDKSYER